MDLWHCARCLTQWATAAGPRCFSCHEYGKRGKIPNPCSGLAAARAIPAQRGSG